MVSEEARVANEEAAKVKAIEKDCNADLAVAMPMLQEAIKALDTLSQKDISEVRPCKLDPKFVCTVQSENSYQYESKVWCQISCGWVFKSMHLRCP